MTSRLRTACMLIAIALVAIFQAIAPAHGQGKNPKAAAIPKGIVAADLEPCRAEIEESYRVLLVGRREYLATKDAEIQRPNQSPKWIEYLREKRALIQRALDDELEKGPMLTFLRPPLSINETRPEALRKIKEFEQENELMRANPKDPRLTNTIGVELTQEAAQGRIAWNQSRICAFRLRVAQLDGKPTVRAAPTAPVPPAGERVCEAQLQEVMKHDRAYATRFKTTVNATREVLESMVQSERQENPDKKALVARRRERLKESVSELKEAEAEKNQSEIYGGRIALAANEYYLCRAIAYLNDTSSPNSPAAVGGDAQPSRPAPAGGEPRPSQQQIATCSDEIKRTQIESQNWTGNADDVAARLGRFQKDLFEGRCAGHPDARAYVVGAMKMLAYGGNPAGSGGGTLAGAQPTVTANTAVNEGGSFTPLAPVRPDTKSKEHNPVHNASTCIQIYGPAEMKAHNMRSVMLSMIVNTCPYAISVQWCVAAGNGRAGDCRPGYSNLADLDARGSRGIDADNQTVNYAACRLGKDMGFQAVEKDPRFPFRFSCS